MNFRRVVFRSIASSTCLVLFSSAALMLSGCGGNFSDLPSVTDATKIPIGNLQGSSYGGQQPIWQSHVYLMAASHTGYKTASKSLLQASANTVADTTVLGTPTNPAYYTLTDGGGTFNITGDYTCNYNSANPSQSDQLYILSLQGNANYIPSTPTNIGGNNNPMIGLMAALGQCPATGTFAGSVAFVYVNEVSTIATAYALAGFAANGSTIGTGSSALAATGLANAFANANQLYDIQGSTVYHEARLTTPGASPTGAVPQALLDTLGNILAACVNSGNSTAVPTTGGCLTLYNNTNSAANTADAAIYIAQHPGSNVTNLFGLQGGTPPFADDIPTSSPPKDFSVGINFSGNGFSTPVDVAVDASGDAWVTSNQSKLSKLTPLGVHASGSPFSVNTASYVAVDQTGNAWATSSNSGVVYELTNAGATVAGTPYTNSDFANLAGIAADGGGNTVLANPGGGAVLFGLLGSTGDAWKIGSTGTLTAYANFTGSLFNNLPLVSQIAVDSSGYLWLSGDQLACTALLFCSGENVTRLKVSDMATVSFTKTVGTYGCLIFCNVSEQIGGIAIDANGNGWVPLSGTTDEVAKVTSGGSQNNYTGGGLNNPQGVAVDGANNIWITNTGNSSLSEFTGAGAAVTSSGYTGGTLSVPTALDIDESGDIWVVNSTGNSVTEFIGLATPVVRPLAAAVAAGTLGKTP